MNKDYIPFGEEWKNEMSKFTKQQLIDMLADTKKKLKQLEEEGSSELVEKEFNLNSEELQQILTKYADFMHHTFYSTSQRDTQQRNFLHKLRQNSL